MKEKVVLAYSGGLDTSVIIPWLKEHYDYEVIAVCGDVGQGEAELQGVEEKGIKSGASKVYVENIQQEFVEDFIFPTLQAQAVYENKYLLGTSMARPAIAKRLVEVAQKEGAVAICHGCTGKGNDQVRFELGIKALAPQMKIIAPWREWEIRSRTQEIEYAQSHGIEVPVKKDNAYSMDRNLWHLSHEGMDLEDPANEPKDELLMIVAPPADAPNEPEYVEVEFACGIPVAVNGVRMGGIELITQLNKIGARHGIGVDDIVENRLVGMKSRGVYENPGGSILYYAHNELETLTLDKDTYHYKQQVALRFGELVYNGQWFTGLREALWAFVSQTQRTVSGKVKMKLYKGGIYAAGVTSPHSLYSEDFATFEEDEVYSHKDAQGFINLFGLPIKIRAMMEQKSGK